MIIVNMLLISWNLTILDSYNYSYWVCIYHSWTTNTTTIVICNSPIHTTSTCTATNTTSSTITSATWTLTTINSTTMTLSFIITSNTLLLRAARPKFPGRQRPRQIRAQSMQDQRVLTKIHKCYSQHILFLIHMTQQLQVLLTIMLILKY